MSHQKERLEKNCLNCNAEVLGHYCQVCGQENIEIKESFWSLATHFVYDVTHFDGKFFSTLKYLLFRPGFLSKEYLRGRRTAYLHPIRMYVFTSAIFFLILFSFYQKASERVVKINEKQKTTAGLIKELEGKKNWLNKSITVLPDTISKGTEGLEIKKGAYNVKAYDSIQNSLPPSKRKNFFVAKLQRQNLILKEKYGEEMNNIVLEKFRHLFPQMLFVSLPIFALFLTLLYIRRKELFYVNHVVFTIHLYCATFILLLGSLWFGSILGWVHLKTGISNGFFSILVIFYWYKAFRNFYTQSRKKTILKYVLLIFLNIFLMLLLFVTFFAFSFFAI